MIMLNKSKQPLNKPIIKWNKSNEKHNDKQNLKQHAKEHDFQPQITFEKISQIFLNENFEDNNKLINYMKEKPRAKSAGKNRRVRDTVDDLCQTNRIQRRASSVTLQNDIQSNEFDAIPSKKKRSKSRGASSGKSADKPPKPEIKKKKHSAIRIKAASKGREDTDSNSQSDQENQKAKKEMKKISKNKQKPKINGVNDQIQVVRGRCTSPSPGSNSSASISASERKSPNISDETKDKRTKYSSKSLILSNKSNDSHSEQHYTSNESTEFKFSANVHSQQGQHLPLINKTNQQQNKQKLPGLMKIFEDQQQKQDINQINTASITQSSLFSDIPSSQSSQSQSNPSQSQSSSSQQNSTTFSSIFPQSY
ncbi:MAG: hypothetical protein EZS28_027383, partial [Streblomastix strix]